MEGKYLSTDTEAIRRDRIRAVCYIYYSAYGLTDKIE